MAIIDHGKKLIREFLPMEKYYIPDYQREYSWEKDEQVEDFWNDLEYIVKNNISSHFFGQIVIHEKIIENDKRNYIIDGQQRISTCIIFLSVIRDKFQDLKDFQTANHYSTDITSLYIGRYNEREDKLNLILGQVDKDFFKNSIQTRNPDTKFKIETESHKKIADAFNKFKEELENKIKPLNNDTELIFEEINKYYEAFLNKFEIIFVKTNDDNEAFIIFETLNARGKDLETSDLLKNYLYKNAVKKLKEVKNNWEKTFETLGKIDITVFLRHFWNSKYEFTREKYLFRGIRDKIKTPTECLNFSKHFYDLSETYKSIAEPNEESVFDDKEIYKILQNLKILNTRSFYPLILSMKAKDYDENDIRRVLKLIETFYFRNCVVSGFVANRYEHLFSDIALFVSESKDKKVNDILNKLKDDLTNDEQLKNKFADFSIKSVNQAKYVLREINDFNEKEISTEKSNYKINLEHIMPKTLNKDWPIDQIKHKEYLNYIGNLTLLGEEYNKKIQNYSFTKKCETYSKSKLNITNSIQTNDNVWNLDSIKKRQSQLFEIALKRWSLDV